MIFLDGSILEGGGQILRIAVAISSLLGRRLSIDNIRARRPRPGLAAQHKLGIELAGQVSEAQMQGVEIDSTEIIFKPTGIKAGVFEGDTKTAGSTTLLVQSLLPILIYGDKTSLLVLRGGTNATMAPPVDYFSLLLLPLLRRLLNIEVDLNIKLRGFFPKGGGKIDVKVNPLPPNQNLPAFELLDRGEIVRVFGRAFVAGTFPAHLAGKMAEGARKLIAAKLSSKIDLKIEAFKDEQAFGNGAAVVLFAETSTGCLLSGSSLPKRGQRIDDRLGVEAAEVLLTELDYGGAVDQYTQDQLIIFMALAQGRSAILTGPITLHTKTAIFVCEKMLNVKFDVNKVKGNLYRIECYGCGFFRNMKQ